MNFVLEPVNQVPAVVEIYVPVTDKKSKKQDMEVTFRKLSHEEGQAIGSQILSGELSEDEVLLDNILDVKGVTDSEGNEIPYSRELVQKLLNIEYVRGPVGEMFQKITLGSKKYAALAAKN